MSQAADILHLCTSKGLRLTAAESCTGGMVAAALTDLPGSSASFERGFVTYTNTAKTEMLGVSPATLAAHGAVSEQVAREMALGALTNSDTHIAVSITGIAGPGGSEFKPEGRVCFGLAVRTPSAIEECSTETIEFGALGRDQVRLAARNHALSLLSRAASAF
ncbi:CinA family protein [Shimia abyssi]|uniref:Nicotinamide-nucleotide amidase n=1 Tax=Shimia abyssi TaxID=1662395 RepID=A0A2P8F6K5_9RHOB|nr:CinA family protein [Shimia abyssi]PSL17347.1 nicotinamide-nucleotide amidase [Shimia abyssi]